MHSAPCAILHVPLGLLLLEAPVMTPTGVDLPFLFFTFQVRTGTQEVRADAAVNSGNTLAAWAELLLPPRDALQMLARAQQAYRAALEQEEDAAVR